MIPHTTSVRNAPTPASRLSTVVDVVQAAIDDARAAGLHGVADELDMFRARVAWLAIRLWRGEGDGR